MISKTKRTIGFVMAAIFVLILVFHILVITGIIPYTIVWGGRLQSLQDMYRFEIVSILLNALFLLVICLKMGLIRLRIPAIVINGMLLLMTVLFFANTIGNLLSVNQWERVIFTPITLLLSVASLLLVRKEKKEVQVYTRK